MSDETFYGVALTGEKNTVTWDVLSNDEEYAYPQAQKLIIKQILLGAEAKEDEFNVVEVQTVKDSIKIPLAVLKAGETRALNPDVEFYDTAVTFTLIKGSGPVYIHGQNIKDEVVDVDIDDEETDEDDEAEDDADDKPPKKKLKPDNNVINEKNQKNKKK